MQDLKEYFDKEATIYVDMDGVVANYYKAYREAISLYPEQAYPQAQYKFFENLEPIYGAIEAMRFLNKYFNVFLLTRPSFRNPLNYTEKRVWVEKYLGIDMCKKLMLAPDKTVVRGDFLIDDNVHTGLFEPEWEHIHFGSEKFPGWVSVISYLDEEYNLKRHLDGDIIKFLDND